MKHMPKLSALVLALALPNQAFAQSATDDVSPDSFSTENAILDTSILFAIGAQEAQQQLRGSFGWPTFQEGLVEGVYFRFDPDGYARFSTSARLDTDVFEVICRPRTVSCEGRKAPLTMMLNAQNQLQLKVEGVAAGDRFFVSEGASEVEVPDRILLPLETRLEDLLSSGGELVVRRGADEVARVSLAGFAAVASYLRWIVAHQDYSVLPRNWPVPNAGGALAGNGLTSPASWQSPMPQPQLLPQQTMLPQAPADSAATAPAQVQSQVAEVRGELNVLRDLLLKGPEAAAGGQPTDASNRIAELESAASAIQQQLQALQAAGEVAQPAAMTQYQPGDGSGAPLQPPLPAQGATLAPAAATAAGADDQLAMRLSYLIKEIGLDPQTALMLLQLDHGGRQAPAPLQDALNPDQVVSGILSELQEQAAAPAEAAATDPAAETIAGVAAAATLPVAAAPEAASQMTAPLQPGEFQLLSDYFRSVMLQQSAGG